MSIGLKEFIDKYSGFAVVFSKNMSDDNYLASYTVYKDGERFNTDVAFDKEDEVDLNTIMNDVLNSFDIYLNKGYTAKDTEADKILRDCVEEIKIKYHTDKIDKLDYIDGKSDWIDLRAAEDVELKKGEFKLVSLGISIKLPTGYEAHIVPRSSTFKNFKIIQTNNVSIIDNSYSGTNDIWRYPVYAMEDTVIHTNDRICQFRIVKNQPKIKFTEVEHLDGKERGGFGSTGVN